MINSSDTIGNRNRDLPACNALPQTTELQREVEGGELYLWAAIEE